MSETHSIPEDEVAVLHMDGLEGKTVRTIDELHDLRHAMRLHLKSMDGTYDVVTVPRNAVTLPVKEFRKIRFVQSAAANATIHTHPTEVLLLTTPHAVTDTLLTTRSRCARKLYELLTAGNSVIDRMVPSHYLRRQLIDVLFEAKDEGFAEDFLNEGVTGLWQKLCIQALRKSEKNRRKDRASWFQSMREYQLSLDPSFIHWKDTGAGMIDIDVPHARSLLKGNSRTKNEQLRVYEA